MKNSIILSTITIGFVALSVHAAPDLSNLPPAAKKDGVTYAKDIRPILENSCFGCHGEKRSRAGLRLDSLEAALKGGEDGKVIVPGKSEASQLVLAVARVDEKTAMPPKGRGGPGRPPGQRPGGGGDEKTPGQSGNQTKAPGQNRPPMGPPAKPLTTEQVALIRAWVDQGAK